MFWNWRGSPRTWTQERKRMIHWAFLGTGQQSRSSLIQTQGVHAEYFQLHVREGLVELPLKPRLKRNKRKIFWRTGDRLKSLRYMEWKGNVRFYIPVICQTVRVLTSGGSHMLCGISLDADCMCGVSQTQALKRGQGCRGWTLSCMRRETCHHCQDREVGPGSLNAWPWCSDTPGPAHCAHPEPEVSFDLHLFSNRVKDGVSGLHQCPLSWKQLFCPGRSIYLCLTGEQPTEQRSDSSKGRKSPW